MPLNIVPLVKNKADHRLVEYIEDLLALLHVLSNRLNNELQES